MPRDWTELDLPRPPSVNRFMRKLGNQTPCVRAWIGEADYLWAARKVEQSALFAAVVGRGTGQARLRPPSKEAKANLKDSGSRADSP